MNESKYRPPQSHKTPEQLHRQIGNTRHVPIPGRDAYTELTQVAQGKRIPDDTYDDYEQLGTSDNPRTGKYNEFIHIENVPSQTDIDTDPEMEKPFNHYDDEVNNRLPIHEDTAIDKTSEAWRKKNPKPGKTISSEQILDEYGLPTTSEIIKTNIVTHTVTSGESEPMRPRISGKIYPRSEIRASVTGRKGMSRPHHTPDGTVSDTITTQKERINNMQKGARPTKKRSGRRGWTRETII